MSEQVTTTPPLDVSRIIADPTARVIVCCGSGGVGKTTTAAAIALRAAEAGRKVVVLTIDPARRLAQSLGVADLDNTPQRVELGPEVPGQLHAMMLNMRRTFDDMVLEHTSPEKAEQIFANPIYQTVASSFGGTQEYMAMEKLGQLAGHKEWDLIVVDTPPSRNALDFLDAPKRLGNFLNGKMIRLIMAPGRGVGRFVTGAMSLAMRGVSTIVGGQMLKDASTFLQSLESLFGGFQDRAERTFAMLSKPGTHFLVVAAPEPDALREASFFVDRLSTERMPLAGLVLNRTHPALSGLSGDHALTAADQLSEADPLTASVLRIHAERVATAKREQRLLHRFTGAHPRVPIVSVTALPFEVSDLDALRAVGDQLAGKPAAV
ncbi:ArsA family ATPase [Nocardia asteroides NBRC 15531]|uniref:Anion-transporting ATPase n=1 Tax=Nocardia asteroides NBRC 15531 TaxID=1110697 RepID=U5EBM8_NOCAS|nr:ArsA family ATPase [Nocardia asteroides]TLF68797.1 ArsA family ATPase [Nocardia asteroides NBRC 15531]UGT48254.1 ArsA family ATPase [Nocardia asteroides]SFL53473.1 arsenite efflux ATP-binding protein ArsA [Nocardia asteroides]VEG32649.1 Oxyanion-translocating ATPase [Nocardia asteroides]GAD84740.1 putative anion-transporting ATPase [Nocardia asteroides NBRC 15531]